MSETWYCAEERTIKPVLVEKFNSRFVWIDTGKAKSEQRRRTSELRSYHTSWAEAKQRLLDQATARVLHARSDLARANDILGNVKGLKESPCG